MTDSMKPAAMPPGAVSNDDEVLRDEMSPPAAPSASGGYGTASGGASSGGTGEGTENTSNAGHDDQSDWLREAPDGSDER